MIPATPALGSTFSSVHDLFHSTAITVAGDVVLFLAVLFWLALGFWVNRDARNRIDDPWLVAIATLLALVPPYLGPLVYLLFRPVETLGDAHARTAELRLLERHLRAAPGFCPGCGGPVESDFLVCPVCVRRLREPCGGCEAPLEPSWRTCPYCAEPVAALDEALARNGRAALHTARQI